MPPRLELPCLTGGCGLRDFDNKRCRTGAFAFAKATYAPSPRERVNYARMRLAKAAAIPARLPSSPTSVRRFAGRDVRGLRRFQPAICRLLILLVLHVIQPADRGERRRSPREGAASSSGTIAIRVSVSGSSRNRATEPRTALAPFCICLLTSIMCRPLPVGNREVRKEKPLISPFTFNRPLVPQILGTSRGTRMMTQFTPDLRRSSLARKDFAVGLVIFFTGRTAQGSMSLVELTRLDSSGTI